MSTVSDEQKNIVFIQYDILPLRTGTYALTATETVPGQTPGSFPAAATFVVQGERFSIQASEIVSVFPPPLANGEFDGTLPHVVFSRRTLPWERSLRNSDQTYDVFPWLAILLFDDSTAPQPQKVTAKDLVPLGTAITVTESTVTGTGTLDANILSYGASTLVPMGYGETPDDQCLVIDIPIGTFNNIAPAAADLQYLAHIREVDISDGADAATTTEQYAVVVGNRIPVLNKPSRAHLVSLENMADYLPAADGTQSGNIKGSPQFVRLLTYRNWAFTANDLDQTLQRLLENLNTAPGGGPAATTLQLPITGTAPTQVQVDEAMVAQSTGTLTADGATVLVQNALQMGYVPLNHHLRHGGKTVSWYRGPLVPYAVATTIEVPIGGPDAANRYNPQTGLFDVSYGVAWQLGQLIALQNGGIAATLYNWKRSVAQQQAAQAEQDLIKQLLDNEPLLESFFTPRAAVLGAGPPPLPTGIPEWFGALAMLQGVPFNYLVPDERMLPPESLRFFFLDFNWIDALIDGAFSIGQATTGEATAQVPQLNMMRAAGRATMGKQRALVADATPYINPTGQVTGFVMRSQAVSGWPNLRFKGYSDADATALVPKLRLVPLAKDTLFCLFDGVVQTLRIQEPPEQLHMGVEGKDGVYFTTLREVGPPNPGQQYVKDPKGKPSKCDPTGTNAVVCVNARSDQQTLQLQDAALGIGTRLVDDFGQTLPNGMTSAEFAVEMTKGVLMVEYQNTGI